MLVPGARGSMGPMSVAPCPAGRKHILNMRCRPASGKGFPRQSRRASQDAANNRLLAKGVFRWAHTTYWSSRVCLRGRTHGNPGT